MKTVTTDAIPESPSNIFQRRARGHSNRHLLYQVHYEYSWKREQLNTQYFLVRKILHYSIYEYIGTRNGQVKHEVGTEVDFVSKKLETFLTSHRIIANQTQRKIHFIDLHFLVWDIWSYYIFPTCWLWNKSFNIVNVTTGLQSSLIRNYLHFSFSCNLLSELSRTNLCRYVLKLPKDTFCVLKFSKPVSTTFSS